jgi:hypothetical protein
MPSVSPWFSACEVPGVTISKASEFMTYGFFLTDETASMCSETYDIAPLSLRNHTRRSTTRPLHIPAFTDIVASPLLMTPSLNREYTDPSNNAGSILNNLEIEYEMDVG